MRLTQSSGGPHDQWQGRRTGVYDTEPLWDPAGPRGGPRVLLWCWGREGPLCATSSLPSPDPGRARGAADDRRRGLVGGLAAAELQGFAILCGQSPFFVIDLILTS